MRKNEMNVIRDFLIAVMILAASTLTGFLFRYWELHETNVVVVYIFSVLLIARYTRGYVYGLGASVISLLLFNWFFTEPYFTLKVHDMTYIITFAIMMFTSIVTSTLTSKVKQSAASALERENETNALYQMTNLLTDAEDWEAIAGIIITTIGDVLGCNVACVCFDEQGFPENTFIQGREDRSLIRREVINPTELRRRIENLHAGMDVSENDCLYPVYGKNMILSVLMIPRDVGVSMSAAQTRMLHSIIESASLAFERLRSIQQQARSREETTQERYRANLLRAISHDIRTPLSGIMGTGEMLLGIIDKDEEGYELVKDICRDAQWLHGMVENILNLTRIQDGKLALEKQPEVVEEVIGAALLAMEKRLPDRSIDVEIPENIVMAPMDARLISQVLINLLDNAVRHTSADDAITVSVGTDDDYVRITVADRGVGIPERDIPHIFQMFYTNSGRSADSRRGVGLGLAICQSIVEAHGGKISAENRLGGGAAFTFTLPLGGETDG